MTVTWERIVMVFVVLYGLYLLNMKTFDVVARSCAWGVVGFARVLVPLVIMCMSPPRGWLGLGILLYAVDICLYPERFAALTVMLRAPWLIYAEAIPLLLYGDFFSVSASQYAVLVWLPLTVTLDVFICRWYGCPVFHRLTCFCFICCATVITKGGGSGGDQQATYAAVEASVGTGDMARMLNALAGLLLTFLLCYPFRGIFCAQMWHRMLLHSLPQLLHSDSLGRLARSMFSLICVSYLSLPFFLTSPVVLQLVAFFLGPAARLYIAMVEWRRPQFDCLSTVYSVLIMLVFLREVYTRYMKVHTRRRLDEIFEWALEHPYHAEMHEDFVAPEEDLVQSGQRICKGITRQLRTALAPPRVDNLRLRQQELNSVVRSNAQKSMGRMGILPSYLRGTIRRECLWEDSKDFLLSKSSDELLAPSMSIVFKNEPAVDMGGPLREWFDAVARCLMVGVEDSGGDSLMVMGPDGALMPRSCTDGPSESRYRDLLAAGRFFALAVLQHKPLPLPMSEILCKHMLHVPVDACDVRRLDPQFFRHRVEEVLAPGGLDAAREVLGEELVFTSAPTEYLPRPEPLVRGGECTVVTEQNKVEYARLLCEAFLCAGKRTEIQLFLQGFWDLIPPNTLHRSHGREPLVPRELALFIEGVQDLDATEWRRHTGGDYMAPYTDWFWEVVTEMGQEQRSLLLHFATGSSRLPPSGFQDLHPKFRVEVQSSGNPEHLPHAHTCFNQIILSPYASKDVLKEKLLLALRQGEGFGFI